MLECVCECGVKVSGGGAYFVVCDVSVCVGFICFYGGMMWMLCGVVLEDFNVGGLSAVFACSALVGMAYMVGVWQSENGPYPCCEAAFVGAVAQGAYAWWAVVVDLCWGVCFVLGRRRYGECRVCVVGVKLVEGESVYYGREFV